MMRLVLLLLVLTVPVAAIAFEPFQQAGIDRVADAAFPLDAKFLDESGNAVTVRQLAGGRPVVLAPVLHNCPNICGVTLAGLIRAVTAQSFVPGRDFTILAFGIDPAEGPEDAAAALERLAQSFPDLAAASVHGLTGSEENVHAATEALGYRYAWDDRIGQYAHIAAAAVLTPDGRLARWLYGVAPEPTDLRLALTEAGQGRIGDWGDQLLLLCYHYDPQTGQYGSLVWTMLRIGGGATVMAGGLFLARMIWVERRNQRGSRV